MIRGEFVGHILMRRGLGGFASGVLHDWNEWPLSLRAIEGTIDGVRALILRGRLGTLPPEPGRRGPLAPDESEGHILLRRDMDGRFPGVLRDWCGWETILRGEDGAVDGGRALTLSGSLGPTPLALRIHGEDEMRRRIG